MWKLQNADHEIVSCDDNKVVTSYFRQLLWNHSARLTVQLSFLSGLGRRIAEVSGETREASFRFQRLTVESF